MKKVIFLLLAAGSMFAFNSCTKTGPQGPTGNANVIGENSFVINTWSYNNGVYYASLSDDNITTDVANNGLVEIYKLYGIGGWTNLPDIDGATTTVFNFTPGNFVISILNTDGTTPAPPGSVTFRVVVVPSSLRKANPHTNWNNFTEAMAAINNTATTATKVQ